VQKNKYQQGFIMSQRLRRELDFLLFDALHAERLVAGERFSEFNIETISAVVDTAQKLADTYFAPHYKKGDEHEPHFKDGKAYVLPEVKTAWNAMAEAGMLSAQHDYEWGGMQLPQVVQGACTALLFAANTAFAAYPFLTIGAANLIRSFGSDEQKAKYLPPMLDGRSAGTMALTEPAQGSALADIKTMAYPQSDGSYHLEGGKIYISGGDQDITDNIVHMVLAKIPGAPDGVKGISMFICPKFLINEDGTLGARNDVALAGLLHKMGYKQTTSTVLNFGENKNCKAWLVGEAHKGLDYMFQMMNEARIGVATGAAALGMQGYYTSLDYAKDRPQGRLPTNKDPSSPQVAIIKHADVKRMLLAQKAYSEGALLMALYAARLVDEHVSNPDPETAKQAGFALDFITPIVKTFASEYALKANDLAIQVHGGAGYIREYPVEQNYRDNRLNPIHEGTTGIQALDLLGRKLTQHKGASFKAWLHMIDLTLHFPIKANLSELAKVSAELKAARDMIEALSAELLAKRAGDIDLSFANATVYLDMAGRISLASMWLHQACTAQNLLNTETSISDERQAYLKGKVHTMHYVFEWELPQIYPQAELLKRESRVTLDMHDDWF
jgi:alkylation response protein AidB-like acyl-CoA dehydrogenase